MEPIEHITKVRVGHGTHEGMTGKHNEDSYGFFAWQIDDARDLHLAIVADGIGGQAAGERASSLAVQTIRDYFTSQKDAKELPAKMAESIRQANEAIVTASSSDMTMRGMGTTIVLAAIVADRLYTAYVGDSRIYLLRGGRLQQLTVDHTWAQEAIEAGLLTRQEAKTHPNRNVIKRYLGNAGGVEIDHRLVLGPSQANNDTIRNQGVTLRPGDVLLLCSDGLSDMIDDSVIQQALEDRSSLQNAVDVMIDKANEAGGRDNITVVALGIPAADGIVPITKALPAVPAAVTGAAATTKGPALPRPQARPKKRRWPWLVGAGIFALLIVGVLLSMGVLAFLGSGADGGDNNVAPAVVATTTPASTAAGSDINLDEQATAGIREADETGSEGEATSGEDGGTAATPTLEPTLKATFTATPTPRPIVIPPTASNTPEPPDNSGGGNGNPPPATNTRPSPNTPTPPPPTADGGGSETP